MAKQNKKFNYDDVFPTRFRELIKYRNVTFDVLAEAFSTTRQTVSNWQAGSTVPDAISISMIADYFGVTTDYLLGKTDASTVKMDLRAAADYIGLTEEAIEILRRPVFERETQSDVDYEAEIHGTMSLFIESRVLTDLAMKLNTFFDTAKDKEKTLIGIKEHLLEAKEKGTLYKLVYSFYPKRNEKGEVIKFCDLDKFPEKHKKFIEFVDCFSNIDELANFIVDDFQVQEDCDLLQFQMQKILTEEIQRTEKEAIAVAHEERDDEQDGTNNEENG